MSGFGLYVHWPFCLSKCPYCDFNSHVAEEIDHDRWRGALLAELDHAARRESPGDTLDSIFFGGGTPSLMRPATVAAIIEHAAKRWTLAGDIEITLEANPTSVEAGRLGEFRAAGINRVSLGVQALDDRALAALGRGHNAAEALAAVRLAARLFDRFSFDLIYARPGQGAEEWRAELSSALTEAGGHLSLYQLTIEPGTAFHTLQRRGELKIPDENSAATLYEITQEIMEQAGLPGYEISNHARPGDESRHNLTYWRYGNYIGIGPGAHGRVTHDGKTVATRRHRAPAAWLDAVAESGHGTQDSAPVSDEDRLAEILMMGLRLREGVTRRQFETLVGVKFEDALVADRLAPLVEERLIELDDTGLRASAAGRQRLDSVLAYLLA
jgi:oxygen-independent coproporphyrinogen-3 oxidase